ncbi:MAG: DUF5016 domain-containing protein [Paludibacter sp.]|nr:DUF5016 domain-containing protein [Paludibacter sp.]
MKNKIKKSIFGMLAILFLMSCQQDELRVRFPASMPVFDSIAVAEDAIMYGDSISLSLGVSDPLTPLSTLEIKVVVNDEIITSETIRTKGSSATYAKRYRVPFVAHMPDGAEVEVHVSSINIEGTKKDTVIFNTIASRPSIPTIYLVSTTSTAELKLIDAPNHIYEATGLTFGNEVSFRLVTKVDRFKKADWKNPDNIAFGWVNGGLGLVYPIFEGTNVKSVTGELITLSDATLVGFNKFTLDLFNFTVKGDGDKLVPATSMDVSAFATVELSSTSHLNVATKENWKKGQMYLGKGTVMTITGMTDLANSLTPDFFNVKSATTAEFLGETGIYTVYYLPGLNYLWVEQPNAVYPDVLWLCGVGFGPHKTPNQKYSSWNWNTPLEYKFCRKVSPGVYEAVIYVEHVIDASIAEPWRKTFNIKFYHQRGWGGEEDARTYTMPNTLLYAPTESDKGNYAGTAELATVPGVYRFTINTTTKTSTFVKIN